MVATVSNPIHKFVGRGDIGGVDFNTAFFTTNGNWQDFDLSAIVPANAIAVGLRITIKDNAPNQYAAIRPKGHGIWHAGWEEQTQVADVSIISHPVIEFNPAYPGMLEYRFGDTVWTEITIQVISWRI